MAKPNFTCFTLLFLVAASLGCFAQNQQFNCPALAVTGDDGGGYLMVTQNPCTFTAAAGVTAAEYESNIVTLLHPATISLVVGYEDAVSAVSVFESYVEITTPGGITRKFSLYEDRNPNGPIITNRIWPLAMNLPAGTTIQYEAKLFLKSSQQCAGPTGCLFNGRWELQGNL